ncbi:MAG: hypothetical protein HZC55_07345 [Verrucomicrobia bacterium]|nr:hypothetical protein [Verrucomicrobiota bacterium]
MRKGPAPRTRPTQPPPESTPGAGPAPRSSGWRSWALLGAVWVGCAALAWFHAVAEWEYLDLLNGLGLREAPAAATPLRQVIPARHADAQMWVRHALVQQQTGALRLRFTPVDNAPTGREVHWSSGFLWLLRGAAALPPATSSPPAALEQALRWFNLPLLLVLLAGFSAWVTTHAGARAGVIVAAGLIGHNRFYEGFAPTNVDHHGLINAALLGLLLGVVFMGAGWWRNRPDDAPGWLPASPRAARRAAAVAGLCGGIGLGLSAAAVIPLLTVVGLSGGIVAWCFGPEARRQGAEFDPTIWRIWGRVGAGTSLLIYLLEYAPAHLGLRLEVNHPFHALAWWGGAEWIAQVAAWRIARATGAEARLQPGPLVAGVFALAAAPATVTVAGPSAFLVLDPFVGALRHFVAEGRSLPAFVSQSGIRPVLFELGFALLIVPAVLVIARRRGPTAIALGWLVLVNAALLALMVFEVRWSRTASVAQLALLLLLATCAAREFFPHRHAWIAVGVTLLLLVPAGQRIAIARTENRLGRVTAGDLLPPLYRDLAAALRASQPEGDITLLSSPNASAGIAYFGQFRSLGTLFWENVPGLRDAAAIFSAGSDDEALRLLRERNVTHIALLAQANFLGEYHRLLHPAAPAEAARETFGYRLLTTPEPPLWLQPIPYRPPPDLQENVGRVRLFRLAPTQDEADWAFHTAVAHAAAGEAAVGERTLDSALDRLPSSRRPDLLAAAGTAFYDFGADAIAARLLQRSLRLQFHPPVAVTAAWILATSRDAAVRDGLGALLLAERALQTAPVDPTALSALAASHAELGRFPAAVAAAERALAAVRAAGDGTAVNPLQRRLDSYRRGQPWRQ